MNDISNDIFKRFWKNGHGCYLVGFPQPGSVIATGSSLTLAVLGKAPGVLRENGWVGVGGSFIDRPPTTQAEAKKWQRDGAGLGFFTQYAPCIDIDINEPRISDGVRDCALDVLGPAPVRRREGSARQLLIYRSETGHIRKRVLKYDVGSIDVLGRGQYASLVGMHPSGSSYYLSNYDFKRSDLREIDDGMLNTFVTQCSEYIVDLLGYKIVKQTGGSSGTKHDRKPIGYKGQVVDKPEDVLELLKVWRNTDENLPSRDDLVMALRAIKASLGDACEEYWPDVLDWAMEYDGNTEEELTKIWESIKDAVVGWGWLQAQAHKVGYTGDAQRAFDDGEPEELPKDHPMKETPLEKAQRRFIWCAGMEQFLDEATGKMTTTNAFNSMNNRIADYGRSGVNSAAATFINDERSRKVDAATYLVGEPLLTTNKTDKGEMARLNLWRPSNFVAAKDVDDKDVKLWLEHMKLIFGDFDGPAMKHILDVLGFWTQRRGNKLNHAIVLYGAEQGTGKDSAFAPLVKFLGEHNVKNIRPEEIIGQFNSFLCSELVIVNEMNNFKSRETMDRMKSWLATPPWTVTVNMKYAQPFDIPNRMNWLLYTNHADALRMEDSDRRFWVHECLITKRKAQSYYRALWEYYEQQGGFAKVIGWLLQRNLAGFDAHEPPSMTDAKRAMIDAGLPAPQRWVRALFTPNEGPLAARTVVTVAEVKRTGDHDWRINDMSVTAALKQEGFEVAHRVRNRGDILTLWARGDAKVLDPGKMRARYLAETLRSAATEEFEEPPAMPTDSALERNFA